MIKPKHYPFSYHKGMQLVRFEPKNKMFTDIKRLFAEHKLTETDTIILNALCKYEYLNTFLIRTLLEQTLNPCTQSFINKRLSFLESKGLVQRFYFQYIDNDGKPHNTPFIYEATYRTKQLFLKKVQVVPNLDIVTTILRHISFNQFHIFLEKQMAEVLKFSAAHFNDKSDGTYRFLSHGKPASFYVFSIRSEDNWNKAFLNRLRSLLAYMKANNLTCSGIIVICENEMQSLTAEQYRKSASECTNAPIYYICDYAAVAEGHILEHLIYVKPDKNYTSYDIIRVPIDGKILCNEEETPSTLITEQIKDIHESL